MIDILGIAAKRRMRELGIEDFLEEKRHEIRSGLIPLFFSDFPRAFMRAALVVASETAIGKLTREVYGTRTLDFRNRVYDPRRPLNGGVDALLGDGLDLYILLYILKRSVEECEWNKNEWRMMEAIARGWCLWRRYHDAEIRRVVVDVLRLESYIVAHQVDIKRHFADGTGARSVQSEEDVFMDAMSTIVLTNTTRDAMASALAEFSDLNGEAAATAVALCVTSYLLCTCDEIVKPVFLQEYVWRQLGCMLE